MSATKVNNFGSIVNLVYSTCVRYGRGSDLSVNKVLENIYEFQNARMTFVPSEDEDDGLVLYVDFAEDNSHYEIPLDGTTSVRVGNFNSAHESQKTVKSPGITLTFAWGDNELAIDRSGRRVENGATQDQED